MAERICRGLWESDEQMGMQINVFVFQLSYVVSAVCALVPELGLEFV